MKEEMNLNDDFSSAETDAEIVDNFEKNVYPAIAMRGAVGFVYSEFNLEIGRDQSINAIEQALKDDNRVILVTQKDMAVEKPLQSDLYYYGLLAEIKKVIYLPGGGMRITVKGLEKVQAKEYLSFEPYIEIVYQPAFEDEGEDVEIIAPAMASVESYFEHYSRLNAKISKEQARQALNAADIPIKIGLIANLIFATVEEKYAIFAADSLSEKLELLLAYFVRAEKLAELENRINQKVKESIDKGQQEYYLREKIKVINEELGDSEDKTVEIQEINEKIAQLDLPPEVEEKLHKEVKRLNRTMVASPDYAVIRNYLDWVLDLPWGIYTKDEENINNAQKIMDRDHYGLEKVKERILEFLAVRQLKEDSKGPIICLVGPPGVGKTSLARSVADALNKNFVRMSLGGVRDEAEIRGHRRTYIGAMPGRIIRGLCEAKSANPLFLFDEIDKMASDFRGDPAAALLEVLDPEQNKTFSDHFIEAPFDLSKVLFLTTANSLQDIPEPLLDRMEIIELSSYTEAEKLQIARRHLWGKQVEENGLTKRQISITDEAIMKIIQNYTREAGVRGLERKLGALCRRTAMDIASGKKKSARITADNLAKYLGVPRYTHSELLDKDEIGVATGMAWTAAGGELLPIEVSILPGKGNLLLTGQLGDVMKESAQMSLSYIRSIWDKLGLEKDFYEKIDVHIHAPEGAVPKDGPSAGVTLVTAMVSALMKRAVRRDIAMTGEMTLRGKVLPIGGLKEKSLAAYRAGSREIIIPIDNKKDMEEIPAEIREEMTIHLADNITEVLDWALAAEGSEQK